MSQSYEFYAARASEAAAEAKTATLDNVRDSALRAQATFQALADQARAVTRRREKLDNDKAAARAAATAEAGAD